MTIEYTENEIRIYEGKKEIVGWTEQEWQEDSQIVFSIINAINLALTKPKQLKKLLKVETFK